MSILGKGNQVIDKLDGSIRIVDRQVGPRVYFEDGGRLGIALCGRVFPKGVKVIRTPQEQALWADIPNQHAAANKVNFDVWKVIGWLEDEIGRRGDRIAELECVAPRHPSARESSLSERVKYLEGVLRQIERDTRSDARDDYRINGKCQDALYK